MRTEQKFWSEQRKSLKGQQNVHGAFNVYSDIDAAVKKIDGWAGDLKEWDDQELQAQISSIQKVLNPTIRHWLWHGHPYITQFIECHKNNGEGAAEAFLSFVSKKSIVNTNNYGHFIGVMLGYDYVKSESGYIERISGEVKSLNQLGNDLQSTTTRLFSEVEELKGSFTAWDSDIRQKWEDWLNKSSGEHNTLISKHNGNYSSYIDECKNHITDLEMTYQEKLRLEMPAKYWKNSARRYGIQGGLYLISLIISLLLGIYYFSDIFGHWLTGQKMDIQLNSLQGIAIFGTILAIYAFFVRALSRLTFSSFHLMRDAEEREQLAYVYLSLINDNKIDENSRDIVLQSLFSRSETGLLKDESGPTMPGVAEIIKEVTKTK
jgi:gas vesicle protein